MSETLDFNPALPESRQFTPPGVQIGRASCRERV